MREREEKKNKFQQDSFKWFQSWNNQYTVLHNILSLISIWMKEKNYFTCYWFISSGNSTIHIEARQNDFCDRKNTRFSIIVCCRKWNVRYYDIISIHRFSNHCLALCDGSLNILPNWTKKKKKQNVFNIHIELIPETTTNFLTHFILALSKF